MTTYGEVHQRLRDKLGNVEYVVMHQCGHHTFISKGPILGVDWCATCNAYVGLIYTIHQPTTKGLPMGQQTVPRSEKDVQRELERIERFRKVAGHRSNKALDYIEALLRTSDRGRYSYTDEQVSEIIGKLKQATDQLAAAYSGQRSARLRVDL